MICGFAVKWKSWGPRAANCICPAPIKYTNFKNTTTASNNNSTNNQHINNQYTNNYDNYDDDDESDLEYGFPNESDIKKINENSKLEVFRETRMKQCSVCYTNIKFGDIVRKLNCDHIFHQECVDKWLEEKLSCPLCRYKFT